MSNQDMSLRLRLCKHSGKNIEPHILSALEANGFEIEHDDTVDQQNSYACLLVDWRDSDAVVAEHYLSQSGREPVVALIASDQVQSDLGAVSGFNIFVCEEEIGFASFSLRLRRLVARYRDPLTLNSTNAPEAKLLQTVVNNTSDWLFIKDLDHRFLAVSEKYANTLERSRESVIGQNDLEIGFSKDVVLGSASTDWDGFWPQDDSAVASGEPAVETNPYWRVFAGDTRHRRTVRVPLKNHWGEVYALLICSEDVTTIVRTEEVLRERSEMLTKVTQEKLKADHSRLMAELAVTSKNKFIATASHDLRQPLHALGLYLDVLESKVKGDSEQALITKIKNSSNALSVLFNRLLDLSRLDAGVVEVEAAHFPINRLLSSLSEEFIEIAADKSLIIKFEASSAILNTDEILLERILRNLIQNAITHTLEGSVEVSCRLEADHLHMAITDTGPGIPQIEQNKIFSEYYQVEHEGSRPTIGLGLGLAIVRRLVDLLDIKFDLRSEMGKGSMFCLDLPLGDKNLIENEVSDKAVPRLSGHTILIIDDDHDILDGMMRVLQTYGCRTVIAATVDEAIAKLTHDDIVPSMIVADYRLEFDQTGDVAIEKIREEFNSEIPAIIVTGDTSADRLKEAISSGFRLLHKPVQSDELIRVLYFMLSGSEANH